MAYDSSIQVVKTDKEVLLTIDNKTQNIAQWAREYNLSEKTLGERVRSGWKKEELFLPPKSKKRIPSFNEHYFDKIDDEHKAYWIGFIWSDGYLGHRIRAHRKEEYNLKISLIATDDEHLKKFNNDINGKYQIHYYQYSPNAFRSDTNSEARIFITNTYFGKVLKDNYGIVPHREDCSKLINSIPQHLIHHFIRGVIDADGSFCHYTILERGHNVDKYSISICGSEMMLRFIEKYFINLGILENIERKCLKRHNEESRDQGCLNLKLSGKLVVTNTLFHLYNDATIYLDRKYTKYLQIMEVVNCNTK